MQRIKFDDYEVGAELPEHKIGPVKHMDLVRYAGASGDFNPIHTDPDFAKIVADTPIRSSSGITSIGSSLASVIV